MDEEMKRRIASQLELRKPQRLFCRHDAERPCGECMSHITGDVSGIRGSVSDITGDVSYIWGNVSNITGDVSDIRGNVSGITGSVSDILAVLKEAAKSKKE